MAENSYSTPTLCDLCVCMCREDIVRGKSKSIKLYKSLNVALNTLEFDLCARGAQRFLRRGGDRSLS